MDLPTRDEIRSLCTDQSFDRGVTYWEQGRVRDLTTDGSEIRATVRGTHDYEVSIDLRSDTIRTDCSCPYDYAGDCKHVVAVLLTVDDEPDTAGDIAAAPAEDRPGTTDIEALVERATADELRTFLLDLLEDDRAVRERFIAFTGGHTNRSVPDYRREIDRLFDEAAGRQGLIEYDTHIDFSDYHELAETHRERGHVEAATDIYRALAETLRENLHRIDDSRGHYSDELERAVDAYAETIRERNPAHEAKRPHIEYLVTKAIEADHGVARDAYDEALRTLCTTRSDLQYWLDRLDEHVSGVALDPTTLEGRAAAQDEEQQSARTGGRTETLRDERQTGDDEAPAGERTDDVLYTSDFTEGPLTTDEFTGGTLDIEHPGVGPLRLEYFVGAAFDELRVDDPTTVEQHTVDVELHGSNTTEPGIASSLRTRKVLSTYIYLLDQLGAEEALDALYEAAYLEESRFCEQYARHLRDHGNQDRAIEVVEAGLATFRQPTGLRWLATELYRDRNPDAYRDTLKRLFLDHAEWDAYDELQDACGSERWQSIYGEFERQLEDDRRRRIVMYVREGDLEKAFSDLKAAADLSLLREYRDPVATVDPAGYFECYRDRLSPFAAGETGRRHYREVVTHLDAMQGLVPEERFEAFVDRLKDDHSNRPAFLDELDKAGF